MLHHSLTAAIIMASLASGVVHAQAVTSMQIIANPANNLYLDHVWPWPMTALRILTITAGEKGKVADVVVNGMPSGPLTLTSCFINRAAKQIACAPKAGAAGCCVLASPTEIDATPGAPPGDYMVYLAAPGSVVK